MNTKTESPEPVGADGNPPVRLQVLIPTKGFEGIPVGTIIDNPTTEQLAAAQEIGPQAILTFK